MTDSVCEIYGILMPKMYKQWMWPNKMSLFHRFILSFRLDLKQEFFKSKQILI